MTSPTPLVLMTELSEDVTYASKSDGSAEGKRLFIEGIFLMCDIVNRNGRMYPSALMDDVVAAYNRNYITQKRAYGELGHPEGPTVNPDRISHRIVSLTREGTNFVGKAQISSTPMGEIARNLILDGGRLGVSSRGLGSVTKRNGVEIVQDDFFLTTGGDIVIDPSAPSAFVNGIMEGKSWVWDNGLLKESTIAGYHKAISKASSKTLEETSVKMFKNFISELGK